MLFVWCFLFCLNVSLGLNFVRTAKEAIKIEEYGRALFSLTVGSICLASSLLVLLTEILKVG